MASEDLGAPAYRKYDIEAWMPGLERFGEVWLCINPSSVYARVCNMQSFPLPQLLPSLLYKRGLCRLCY